MAVEAISFLFLKGCKMKDLFVKEIITQVFSVYNYTPNYSEDLILEERKTDVVSKIKDKFKIEATGEFCILKIEFYLKLDKDFYEYKGSMKIMRAKQYLQHASFIGLNCIKVLRSLMYPYAAKSIDRAMVVSMIEKTIEESIIAMSLGKKQVNALADPLVDKVSMLFRELSVWSNRTYEGRKIPFSFVINAEKVSSNLDMIDDINIFLKDDSSALLSDGITSYFLISDHIEYKIADVYNPESKYKKIPLVPYRFSSVANVCTANNIGIILTVQGDLLIIKKTKLIYAKRNGVWHYYDYDSFNNALFKDIKEMDTILESKNKIKKIYISCLDTAFARTGGCLAICSQKNLSKIKTNIRLEDIHRPFSRLNRQQDQNKKRFMIEDVIIKKNNFYEMSRKALQELMGIDGATVILTNGKFITTGAIIDNKCKKEFKDKETQGGARKKIAKKLSEYGLAIKISSDGYIECYKNGMHIF